MPGERKPVFSIRFPLRRSDIDEVGHVNNVKYFRFMEEARVAWYDTMGIAGGFNSRAAPSALPPGCAPVVVQASCTFLKGLKFPGDVLIDISVSDPGRSSIMLWLAFRASYAPETVCAEASCKAVWIDTAKEKSIPLPAPIRALFE